MRKAIALVLVVVLVVPLVLGALATFSVATWVLDRGFYLELVSEERLYEALLQEVEREEPHIQELAALPGFDQVPADALLKALREVVTADYLRAQAVRIVNDFFDAVEAGSTELPLQVDLAPLKAQLLGDDGRRFALKLAASLPACAAGQQAVAPGAALYRCRPAELSVEAAAGTIHARLPQFLAELPDLYLLDPEAAPLYVGLEGRFWFSWVGTGRLIWSSVVIAIVAAGFWVGAAFVGGGSRRKVVHWLGWPLVPPALLMLISGLSIRALSLWRWLPRELRHTFAGDSWYTRELGDVLDAVVRTAVNTVSRGFLITGAVTIGVAVGLIVWASSIPADDEAA